MGLDMYLKAKIYLGKYFGNGLFKKANEVRKLFPEMYKSGNLDSVDVKFEVGYWRKANHIHNWFVQNVQNGKDECDPYYVSRKQLEELRDTCKDVINSLKDSKTKEVKIKVGFSKGKDIYDKIKVFKNTELANSKLPAKEGFFFGSTKYNKWYLKDLQHTIKIINKCLKLPNDWDFEYRSSW